MVTVQTRPDSRGWWAFKGHRVVGKVILEEVHKYFYVEEIEGLLYAVDPRQVIATKDIYEYKGYWARVTPFWELPEEVTLEVELIEF